MSIKSMASAAGTAIGKFVAGGVGWQVYAWVALAGAAAMGGAILVHSSKVEAHYAAAFKAGQDEVQARWDRAVSEAVAAQSVQNEQATEQFITEREVVRVIYRDRIKEIKTYVPKPGTSCPADAGFLRSYNAPAASPAGDAADQ